MSVSTTCAICQTALTDGQASHACAGCGAIYHEDCWIENRGCGVFGCAESPPTENLEAVEVPASYWGQEHKPCPRCDEQILATAVRCRHCGARFASQRPEGREEFGQRERAIALRPALGKKIVWLFALSLIPVVAAVAGIVALVTLFQEREALGKLPALYGAMLRLAAFVGLAQSLFLVIVLVLYGGGS